MTTGTFSFILEEEVMKKNLKELLMIMFDKHCVEEFLAGKKI